MNDKSRVEHGPLSEEGLPYSNYVRAGDFIYVSGLVALDEKQEIIKGGIQAETRLVLEDAARILNSAGSSLMDVVKVNICLPNAADFEEFNGIYRTFFPNKPPARASLCASLSVNAKVEMEFIAYRPLEYQNRE